MSRLKLPALAKGAGSVLAIYLALLIADRWGWPKALTIVALVLLAFAIGVVSTGLRARNR